MRQRPWLFANHDRCKSYKAHRLAWLYVYGAWPKDQIDHINGDKADNRIENLRECSCAENHQNLKSHKNASSNLLGVTWVKKRRKWQASITVNGKDKHLGRFETAEAAHQAYLKAKAELHTFNPIPRDQSKKNLAVRLGGAA